MKRKLTIEEMDKIIEEIEKEINTPKEEPEWDPIKEYIYEWKKQILIEQIANDYEQVLLADED